MTEKNWEGMDEREFERRLAAELPELPPDDIAREVTPWRKAVNRILVGIGLNVITLNFLGLNDFLPAVGMILCLLGFRTLRRESGWFRAGLVITAVKTVFCLSALVINMTVYREILEEEELFYELSLLQAALLFALIICLWGGFRRIQRRARTGSGNDVGALLLWYVALWLLAIWETESMWIGIAMIALFLLIIRSLSRTSHEMEKAGYVVEPAPVRVADRTLVGTLTVMVILGMVIACLFFSRYPMEWELAGENTARTEEIREELTDMGFPEAVLKDLTEEDLLACQGATQVVIGEESYRYFSGEDDETDEDQETEDSVEDALTDGETAEAGYNMTLTAVAVRLSNESDTWKIFLHFTWKENPGFIGTESLQVYGSWNDGYAWGLNEEFTGQVLCEREGETYRSPYHDLGLKTAAENAWGIWLGAAFSFPQDCEQARGYVSYTAYSYEEEAWWDSWLYYTHQESRLQYPALTAMERHYSGAESGWGDAFETLYTQFYFETE